MANQSKRTITMNKKQLEWLYVPDMVYHEYDNCKRSLQLIIPYQREWKEDKRYPLIVYIPGSAWHRQEMYNSIPGRSELASRGFAIADVQYRESDLNPFPAQIIDVKNAIRYIDTIAEQYHMDMDNIFLCGDSSGAHVALLTGLTAEYGELDEKGEAPLVHKIRGIITCAAPTNMMLSEGDGPMEDLLGTDDVKKVPELARSASATTYLSKDREIPPILMFHGVQDGMVAISHARELYEALKSCDKEVEYYEIENVGHCSPAYLGEDATDIIADFIQRNVKE